MVNGTPRDLGCLIIHQQYIALDVIIAYEGNWYESYTYRLIQGGLLGKPKVILDDIRYRPTRKTSIKVILDP